MRAFLALSLPEDTQDALAQLQDQIPLGRRVAPESMHVTLAFLEDQPESQLRLLHEALSEITMPALDLQLKGLSALGGKTPRVLVADIVPNAALTALHRKIRNIVQMAGIDLPRVRFRPHVTLLRFSRRMEAGEVHRIGEALQRHADVPLPPFRVEQFALYQSILLPEGPRYEVLAEYPLGDAAQKP